MADPITIISVASVTLPAATETDLLGVSGIDVSRLDWLELQIVNLNASNSISSAKAYKSQDGSHWDEITAAALGTIAASGSGTMLFTGKMMGAGRLRVTATSASGASASVKGQGGIEGR